jgi:hypothetical protein
MSQPAPALVDEPEEDEAWPDEDAPVPSSRGAAPARATTMLPGWVRDGHDDDGVSQRTAFPALHMADLPA